MPPPPRITIGLPVYNGAGTVGRALDSLLAQSCGDFELVVSDNASTDATESICRDYAKADPRIRYLRQPTNIGAPQNFGALLGEADSTYFMWAGCDDVWLPEFVARNIAALEARPDAVCSVSRVEFFDATGATVDAVGPPEARHPLEGGTFPLDGTPAENLVAFLERPQCNTRFYGVHRTAVIRRCYAADERYLASDWVVMARTLAFGKHHEVPEVLLRRSVHGESADVTRLILATNPSWFSRRWLPMWPMTRRVLFSGKVPVDYGNPGHLVRLARILYAKNHAEYHHHRSQLKKARAAAG